MRPFVDKAARSPSPTPLRAVEASGSEPDRLDEQLARYRKLRQARLGHHKMNTSVPHPSNNPSTGHRPQSETTDDVLLANAYASTKDMLANQHPDTPAFNELAQGEWPHRLVPNDQNT